MSGGAVFDQALHVLAVEVLQPLLRLVHRSARRLDAARIEAIVDVAVREQTPIRATSHDGSATFHLLTGEITMASPWYDRVVGTAAFAALLGATGAPVLGQQSRTVNAGVYSEAQARRGQALYRERCGVCHGDTLAGQNGPPLAGDAFTGAWAGQPLSELVNKIKNTMPENDPGTLTRQQSVDLVAHILQVGKFPVGRTDLVVDEAALKLIAMPAARGAATATPVPLAVGHALAFPPAGNMAQVMRGILFPSSNLIFNVQTHSPDEVKTTATGPDGLPIGGGGFSWVDWGAGIYKPWDLVDYAAIALAESAPLMLTPGRRCENGKPVPVDRPNWIKFTEELAEAGRAAYKASQTRNQEAVSDSTNQIADSCLHCHEVYRDRGAGRGPASKANRCTEP